MATAKYTKKTTTAKKDDTPEVDGSSEEIVYDAPEPTTELLELEILRSTTCEEETS